MTNREEIATGHFHGPRNDRHRGHKETKGLQWCIGAPKALRALAMTKHTAMDKQKTYDNFPPWRYSDKKFEIIIHF